MKPFLGSVLLLSPLFTHSAAQATSSIAATWIDNGQTLSIRIVDDPANAPFTAGELWQTIKADRLDSQGNRFVKTGNFELICSAMTDTQGKRFGNCRMRVAKGRVSEQPSELNFAISKDEARTALESFVPSSNSVLIKSGSTDAYGNVLFMFEENWQYSMIAGRINKSIVSQ